MICPNCKKEIDDDSKFCEFCGSATNDKNDSQSNNSHQTKKRKKDYAHLADKILSMNFEKEKKKEYRWKLALCTIAIIFLLLGALTYPDYDFYTLLRVYIFAISIFFSFSAYKQEKIGQTFSFVAIAVLFNPLLPIKLEEETWKDIDFVVALFFCGYAYLVRKEYRKKQFKRKWIRFSIILLIAGWLILGEAFIHRDKLTSYYRKLTGEKMEEITKPPRPLSFEEFSSLEQVERDRLMGRDKPIPFSQFKRLREEELIRRLPTDAKGYASELTRRLKQREELE